MSDSMVRLQTIEKIKDTRSFFEKISKMDKALARLTKKKERIQMNKIRNKRGNVITDTTETWRIIKDYYEKLYSNTLNNPQKRDKFIETYNPPRMKYDETENPNGPNTRVRKLNQ